MPIEKNKRICWEIVRVCTRDTLLSEASVVLQSSSSSSSRVESGPLPRLFVTGRPGTGVREGVSGRGECGVVLAACIHTL